jgi:Arc/MetJ-type ribon-helix-helix transcriptional regulator
MKKPTCFAIGEKENKLLKDNATINGFKSCSDYVNWLIRKDGESRNLGKALEALEKEEEILELELKELNSKKEDLRNQRQKIISQISVQKELQQEKLSKRPIAIQKITELLISQDIFGAETRARTWGYMLNINPSELMAEAIIKRKEMVYGQL